MCVCVRSKNSCLWVNMGFSLFIIQLKCITTENSMEMGSKNSYNGFLVAATLQWMKIQQKQTTTMLMTKTTTTTVHSQIIIAMESKMETHNNNTQSREWECVTTVYRSLKKGMWQTLCNSISFFIIFVGKYYTLNWKTTKNLECNITKTQAICSCIILYILGAAECTLLNFCAPKNKVVLHGLHLKLI